MKLKRALLLIAVMLVFTSPVLGDDPPLVEFQGDAKADFPAGTVWRDDVLGDTKDRRGLCYDMPLGIGSYKQEPINPEDIPASGFNVERVGTIYDCKNDILYIALDICDDRIAWDSDADGRLTKYDPTTGITGALLWENFLDNGLEDYEVDLDVGNGSFGTAFTADMRLFVQSFDGGVTVNATALPLPAGVTFSAYVPMPRIEMPAGSGHYVVEDPNNPGNYLPTEKDIEVKIKGLREHFNNLFPNVSCLPVRIQTRSGATGDLVNEDITDSLFDLCCEPCIEITKGVACSPDGPFLPSATALRGSDVYFQIAVTNCSSGASAEPLRDVVIKDELDEAAGNPLLDCAGCTLDGVPIPNCIPNLGIPIGDLDVGQTKFIVCKFPTNPAFAVEGNNPDATNRARATGVGVYSGVEVVSPAQPDPNVQTWVQATVDVLVPKITCGKLIDDDSNFGADTSDTTAPSCDFRIPSGELKDKQIFYQFCVTNDGEVPVDFAEGQNPNCPSFNDDFIKPGGTEIDDPDNPGQKYKIPGTDQNLNVLFRTALLAKYGSFFLRPGESVCIVSAPVTFDQKKLCPDYPSFTDRFQACGFATCYDDQGKPDANTRCGALCLPPGGGENVSTGICECKVTICPTSIRVNKYASCSPDTPLRPGDPLPGKSVQAVRGSDIYFMISVWNNGGEDLKDVLITDALTEGAGNPLLDCAGCTIDGAPDGCIPGVINIGNLAVNQTKWIVCRFPTNSAFDVQGTSPDATNTASASGVGVLTGVVVNDGPSQATVDVLVPGIECTKLIDDDANPVPGDAGDATPPTAHLNLVDSAVDVEQAWYYYKVCNTGEVAVDFSPGNGCPNFADDFIKPGGTTVIVPPANENYLIPGTDQDLYANFLTALQAKYSRSQLLPGECVELVPEPVTFDEARLCRIKAVWPDTLSVCGLAQNFDLNICGSQQVTTTCSADVTVCPECRIKIEKQVSCWPDRGFGPSVDVLRGADVYFKITVTNTGGENIEQVELNDVLVEEPGNPLLDCAGCTVDGNVVPTCIPDIWQLGTLYVGESRTIICRIPTNPDFDDDLLYKGRDPDATNSATVSGICARSRITVSDGPASATVNLLVPDISCQKLVDDDQNPDPDEPGDLTPPSNYLDLSQDEEVGIECVSYWMKVCNTGEVDVDFTNPAGAECPGFKDSLLDNPIPGVILPPGTDVDQMFRTALQAKFGSEVLPKGQCVSIKVLNVCFDESILCPNNRLMKNTFEACGIAKEDGICLPQSGGEEVKTGGCSATVQICPTCIKLEKTVACKLDGPFVEKVNVMKGEPVFFKIVVTNCGGEALKDVTLTDTLTELVDDPDPLLNCTGCTLNGAPDARCIPGVWNLGTMQPGETKTIVCRVPTNPAFAALDGDDWDAKNCAWATGIGVVSGGQVRSPEAGEDCAEVNVKVPCIEVTKLVDDDNHPAPDDAGDLTQPTHDLSLVDEVEDIEEAWYFFQVCNCGDTPIDFTPGADANCPSFKDDFIKPGGTSVNTPSGPYIIPGTDQDLQALFLAELIAKFGGTTLPAGQCVSLSLPIPVSFDEATLCKIRRIWPDKVEACGIATEPGVCGVRQVKDDDTARVYICPPDRNLYQAYPGDSNELDQHFGGYLGQSGDTISAVPGVFILVPGDKWKNFVKAAQVGVEYELKNVVLTKQVPTFAQCTDVFRPITIRQQGTPNIRLRWPLMYEAPGTTWTLTIQYGTSFPWDDDGPVGPNPAGYYHESEWEWSVDASLESMKLLLDLFHEVPYATDEVPLISDEVLYPNLKAKLDEVIAFYAAGDMVKAAFALGEFEMTVMDACIGVSPKMPYPGGPGTGIANSEENPACCKLLVDAEYVAKKLGLFQGIK
ncbi:MAG: DUF11 domain-containing protein [Armatimonadetes bacterium]|nr:DUF11 domain-containing protein [Armatimonadota bacterium]